MATTHDADVIVIGAGTGGLTAAVYLAAAGRRVLVVERNDVPGGCGTVFHRDGYAFDVGLHYLGSRADGRPAVEPMLRPLGIDLAFNALEPVDMLLIDGQTIPVPTGAEAFRAQLHASFPDEAEAIDRYLDTVLALGTLGGEPPRPRLDDPASIGATARAGWLLLRHLGSTLGDLLDDVGASPRLAAVLSWLTGTIGVAPDEVSLLMHAAVTVHYLNGAWYPQGGGGVITDRLVRTIGLHGGRVLTGHEVTGIIVADGAVRGVRVHTADGVEELSAPAVISAADLKHTVLEWLPPDAVPRRWRRKVRGYEMAMPLFVVYAAIDRDLAAEGFPVTNWLVADGTDLAGMYAAARRGVLPDDAWVWVTSSSLKDPGNRQLAPAGQTNLQLMTVVPSQHAFWGLKTGEARGETYQARKQEIRDRAVTLAERAIPGLADTIVYEETATPYTVERYLEVTGGTSYGIAATPDQLLFGRPGPRTPVAGLFLAGASTRAGHGITGVMAGGMQAAAAVAGLGLPQLVAAATDARGRVRVPVRRVPAA